MVGVGCIFPALLLERKLLRRVLSTALHCSATPGLVLWVQSHHPKKPGAVLLGQQAACKHCCPAPCSWAGVWEQAAAQLSHPVLSTDLFPVPTPVSLPAPGAHGGGQTRSVCPATPVLDLLEQRFCTGSPRAAGALCQQSCPSINGFGDRCLVLWVCWSSGLPAAPPPCALGHCSLLSIAHPGHVPNPSEHSLGRGRHHDGFRRAWMPCP